MTASTNTQITNKTVKPFIKAHDFYPGFKLEEECFSNAVFKDLDETTPSSRKKKSSTKSDLEQGPKLASE